VSQAADRIGGEEPPAQRPAVGGQRLGEDRLAALDAARSRLGSALAQDLPARNSSGER
jgi:hypothetical protein